MRFSCSWASSVADQFAEYNVKFAPYTQEPDRGKLIAQSWFVMIPNALGNPTSHGTHAKRTTRLEAEAVGLHELAFSAVMVCPNASTRKWLCAPNRAVDGSALGDPKRKSCAFSIDQITARSTSETTNACGAMIALRFSGFSIMSLSLGNACNGGEPVHDLIRGLVSSARYARTARRADLAMGVRFFSGRLRAYQGSSQTNTPPRVLRAT